LNLLLLSARASTDARHSDAQGFMVLTDVSENAIKKYIDRLREITKIFSIS